MEKGLSKEVVYLILILAGIAIGILVLFTEPEDNTIWTIGSITYLLMIAAGLVGILSTKAEEPQEKKEVKVIDEKYQKKFAKLREAKWTANALFILSAIEGVIVVCCELGDSLWWLLQGHMDINVFIAILMRMSISKGMSDLKKQMDEEETADSIIHLLNNLEVTITRYEDNQGEHQDGTI